MLRLTTAFFRPEADIPSEGRPAIRCRWSFFADLSGSCAEPGYGPVHLPKLDIVAVGKPRSGFDGGLVIDTIQLNDANGAVVQSDDIPAIERHFSLHVAQNAALAILRNRPR
jgi:hypothetical protein